MSEPRRSRLANLTRKKMTLIRAVSKNTTKQKTVDNITADAIKEEMAQDLRRADP